MIFECTYCILKITFLLYRKDGEIMFGDEGGEDTPNIAVAIEQFGERRGLIRKGLTLRHRVEPERGLLVTDDIKEGVQRTYLNRAVPNNSLEASGLYHLYPNGVIKIRRGYYSTVEKGTQQVTFTTDGPNILESFGPQSDFEVVYNVNAKIESIRIGRFYPRDEIGKNEGSVQFSFRWKNQSMVVQSDSGVYRIIDGEDFVECVKTLGGEEVLRYRVPKKITKQEILAKLVPADLMDYPYEIPAAADTVWRHTDFLQAFGIEKQPV